MEILESTSVRNLSKVTQLGKGRARLRAHFGLLQTLGCVTGAVTEGMLGLRVYCQCLKTFNSFSTKSLRFHFAWGLTVYAAGADETLYYLLHLTAFSPPPTPIH